MLDTQTGGEGTPPAPPRCVRHAVAAATASSGRPGACPCLWARPRRNGKGMRTSEHPRVTKTSSFSSGKTTVGNIWVFIRSKVFIANRKAQLQDAPSILQNSVLQLHSNPNMTPLPGKGAHIAHESQPLPPRDTFHLHVIMVNKRISTLYRVQTPAGASSQPKHRWRVGVVCAAHGAFCALSRWSYSGSLGDARTLFSDPRYDCPCFFAGFDRKGPGA